MPCFDPDHTEKPIIVHSSGISPDDLRGLKRRLEKYKAMLCALMNTLDKRGIAGEVIAEASRHGLVDIMSFWEKHKADDQSRLESELHKNYSIDEQRMLRIMLNQQERLL